VVEPSDAPAIEDAIATLHARWAAGSLTVAPSVRERALARFSRRSLTGRLDAVLSDAAATGGPIGYGRCRMSEAALSRSSR
jgi:hypothetical protein